MRKQPYTILAKQEPKPIIIKQESFVDRIRKQTKGKEQ